MEIKNHILQDIKFLKSPNFNERPANTEINLLAIHSISLPPKKYNTDHIEKFFMNELDFRLDDFYKEIVSLKVSSHLLIKRTGEIIQFVPFNHRAWHAGESTYQGRDDCNDFSIGIELEGTENSEYEKPQYLTLIKLIHALMNEYPSITRESIVGHSDIAPDRKKDPGIKFDWEFLKSKI